MALRNVRTIGDEILRKRSKEIKKFDEKLKILVEDMFETMYDENGVGLAAPQIGILRRVFVIDVGNGPIAFINPEIFEKSEETQKGVEGCLSIPGQRGFVIRPRKVKVKFMNVEGEEQILEAEGLFARAICHENDHINGILFVDVMEDEEVTDEIMASLDEDYNIIS